MNQRKRGARLRATGTFAVVILAGVLASTAAGYADRAAEQTRTLRVHPAGTGSGSVTGPGINCPGDCVESYTQGSHVVLAAHPVSGSSFAGFGGDCAGSTCSVAMNIDRNVTATFVSHEITLGEVRSNTRSGTATLAVNVPGAGELSLSGRGIRSQRPIAGARATARPVSGPGVVELKIVPTGSKKAKLKRRGKVRVWAKVTYSPNGGQPASESTRVTLKRKKHRR